MKDNIVDFWGSITVQVLISLLPLFLLCILIAFLVARHKDKEAERKREFIEKWLKNRNKKSPSNI